MRKLSVNEEKRIKAVLSSNLSKYRKQANLTQEALAEELDMDRVTIAYAETGKRIPKVKTLYLMADVLGVNIKDLFRGL